MDLLENQVKNNSSGVFVGDKVCFNKLWYITKSILIKKYIDTPDLLFCGKLNKSFTDLLGRHLFHCFGRLFGKSYISRYVQGLPGFEEVNGDYQEQSKN